MNRPTWDERIKRAEVLAATYPFAAEILHFYQQIARFQKDFYAYVLSACGSQRENRTSGSLRDEFDLTVLLPRFPSLLSLAERAGPPQLSQLAGELAGQAPHAWLRFLAGYWAGSGQEKANGPDPRVFFARAFLQPYAQYLADHTVYPSIDVRPRVCPLCDGKPQVGVLRREGDGAKRSLICSVCSTEWDYRRLVCVACGEENVETLPVYTASQFDYIRVEACDTCKTYITTVDLTKNGLAVPEVDELAAVPLDLWAREQGYTKLQPNLLGL